MQSKLITAIFLLILIFVSCKKDKHTEESEIPSIFSNPKTPLNNGPDKADAFADLLVPNGFNYSTEQKVVFDFTTVDSTSQPTESVYIKLFGIDANNEMSQLYEGGSDTQGKLEMELDIPNHFSTILATTNYEGNLFQFEFAVQHMISSDLKINGSFTQGMVSETRSNNCYPSITSVYNNDNLGVSLSSDEVMTTIKVYFTDGTSEEIQVNAKNITL